MSSIDQRDRVRALFDRVADVYDNVGVDYFQPIARGLVDELDPRPGERVVDVGCGRGAALVPLAQRVTPGGTVTGIDLSPGMVEACRVTAAAAGVEAAIRVGDAMSPDLPAAAFDVVASSLVLFFLPDPAAALRTWRELLVPGGRLGISTFGDYSARWKAVEAVFNPYIPPEMRDPRTTGQQGPFATDEGVEGLLRDAGYDSVRTSRVRLPVRFVDKDQWHDWSWSVGLRAVWEAMPADVREQVRARAYDALEQTRDADGRMGFDQDVRFTIGHRA
jgi:ubiquinone/menaquinone biosynthesis C-methylase UbiE